MSVFGRIKTNPVTIGLACTAGRILCSNVERFIFCAATGRRGTKTLQRLFQNAHRCSSHHEPFPQLAGEPLEMHNNGDAQYMHHIFRRRKLPRIYWLAKGSRWYFESSHLFILTFCDEAVREFGRKLHVIHVRRDPGLMASSFAAKGWEPLSSPWLPRPGAPGNVLNLSKELERGGRFDHMYFRLLWYWYEVEARVERFRRMHPGVPITFIQTDQLNDLAQVECLFNEVGVPMDEQARSAVGVKANKSEQVPARPSGLAEGDIRDFHQLCGDRLETYRLSGERDRRAQQGRVGR